MITQPIVFVFGAGVSMPYGFPSGRTLLAQIHEASIRSRMTGDMQGERPYLGEIGMMLREEFGLDSVLKFGEQLYLSQQASIDAFLEHRPEFMKIGKTAIALCLARNERHSSLFSMDVRDKGCYQYLFQKMSTNWEGFTNNKVAFITFNYDRSLEEYFFTALKSSYGKSDQECAEAVAQIPIVHVHGSLGPLPWKSPEGIPYNNKYALASGGGEVFNRFYLEQMRDNIIVISEGQDESPELNRAFDFIKNAKMAYFLGFGYHPTNLRRLQISNLRGTGIGCSGTAMGIEDAEIDEIGRHSDNLIYLADRTSDSLLFLRKYVSFT